MYTYLKVKGIGTYGLPYGSAKRDEGQVINFFFALILFIMN